MFTYPVPHLSSSDIQTQMSWKCNIRTNINKKESKKNNNRKTAHLTINNICNQHQYHLVMRKFGNSSQRTPVVWRSFFRSTLFACRFGKFAWVVVNRCLRVEATWLLTAVLLYTGRSPPAPPQIPPSFQHDPASCSAHFVFASDKLLPQ